MNLHPTTRARLILTILIGLSLGGVSSGCRSTTGNLGGLNSAGANLAGSKSGGAKSGGSLGRPGQGSYVLRVAEGQNLEKVGQWDKARDVYKKLIDDHPDRPEGYHRLGVVADRQRRHDEAQQLYTRALRLAPGDPELFNDLGYCFYLQGKLSKAESALQKAVMLESDNPRFRNNLGMVLGQQERYDEALEQFAATGSDADAYYNLAFVHASQDNHAKAETCFRQALNLDPTHDQAREALASFQQYEQRGPAAEGESLAGEQRSSDGVAYVPYVEGDDAPADATQAAATVSDLGTHSAAGGSRGQLLSAQRQADSAARTMHARAAGLLNRRMASQREDEQSAGFDR